MTIMVWKTDAFGSIRVTVEAVSVSGLSTLVRITRNEKYRPALLPEELWVMTSNLHKPITKAFAEPKAKSVPTARVVKSRAAEVASTIKNRKVDELVVAMNEEVRKPRKRAPKVETF